VVDVTGTNGEVASLIGSVLAAGAWVELDGSRLLITTADTAADPDVLHDLVRDAVAAHEVGLLRLQARTTTLEDVFLGIDP
jgi:hypothetical protein